MKYEKSEWFQGLLYAEHMSLSGWNVKEFDRCEQWFSWQYGYTQGIQTAYGSNEWLDGVKDYYKNKADQINCQLMGWELK